MLPSAASLLEGSFEPSAVALPLLEEMMFCSSGSDSQPVPRALDLLSQPGDLGVSASPVRRSEVIVPCPTSIAIQPLPDGEPWVAASVQPWPSGAVLPGYDASLVDPVDSGCHGGVSPNLSKSRLARRWLSKFDDLEDSRSSLDLSHLGKVLEDEPSPVSIVTCFAEWPTAQGA